MVRALAVVNKLPDMPSTGFWALSAIGGFTRTVQIEKIPSSMAQQWRGTEFAFRGSAGFSVSGRAASYAVLRAFLDSFAPLE